MEDSCDSRDSRADDPDDDDSPVITCWCGAQGTYDELFDDSGLPDSCGGLGVLDCECGGDQCVCHHHGETECPGCPDCEEFDESFGDAFDDDFDCDEEEEEDA